jgi:hypothetical protein
VSEDETQPGDIDSTETIEEPSTPPNRIGNYRLLQKTDPRRILDTVVPVLVAATLAVLLVSRRGD